MDKDNVSGTSKNKLSQYGHQNIQSIYQYHKLILERGHYLNNLTLILITEFPIQNNVNGLIFV